MAMHSTTTGRCRSTLPNRCSGPDRDAGVTYYTDGDDDAFGGTLRFQRSF